MVRPEIAATPRVIARAKYHSFSPFRTRHPKNLHTLHQPPHPYTNLQKPTTLLDSHTKKIITQKEKWKDRAPVEMTGGAVAI